MLTIHDPLPNRTCEEFSRRDFLRVGALGAGSLSLAGLLQARAEAGLSPGVLRDKSVVLLFLRERLRPYVMEQMRVAHSTGLPPMRPLFLDFPADPACWDIADQFLFGGDILVAPVVTERARERDVYLPAGADWRDAWTGAPAAGGQWVTAAAPLELIPVYVRGNVSPFGPIESIGAGGEQP